MSSTYHVIRNGTHLEMSAEELRALSGSEAAVELDIEWYLSHGGTTHEEFRGSHHAKGKDPVD